MRAATGTSAFASTSAFAGGTAAATVSGTARTAFPRTAARPARPVTAASAVRDGTGRSLQTLQHVLGADPAVLRGFARAAADRFDEGPLTLDARDRLLRRGERLGLRRFDANLVLAAVEQQQRGRRPRAGATADDAASSTASPAAAAGPRLRLVWPAAALAVVLQGTIAAGAWWLLA